MKSEQPATEERGAFCPTCPPAEDVTALLATLGLHLDFQLDTQCSHMSPLPPLPAQYHYKDACGTEVIYLAGRDLALDGKPLPPHSSRFWLYAGGDAVAFTWVMTTLAGRYQLVWCGLSSQAAEEEVA